MFEDRTHKRTFYSAPQRVRSLIAAFLEPGLTVAAFLVLASLFEQPVGRPELTLCMLVFALTFPGRDRMRSRTTSGAAVHRGQTDTVEKMRARVEFDLEYLHNRSLGLDRQIIARTIRQGFFDKNTC